jgi:membrane-associated phospholipid phosphatase
MGETCGMSRLPSSAPALPAQTWQAYESAGPAAREPSPGGATAVLLPARGNASARLGARLRERRPVVAFLLTVVAGYVILAAVTIAVGFLLVDVLLPVHAIGDADEAVNEWLASNRSASLNDASYVGSSIGDIPFIPALVILTALGAAVLRRWLIVAFVGGAILVEVATYRVTSLIVHRQRPDVPRLDPDNLPVDQSYPSGHVAASVVVYAGLALLLSAKLHSSRARILLWAGALSLPLVVALSRMYRGMHHPLDTGAGVLMGSAALALALFATRAAGETARLRSAGGRR